MQNWIRFWADWFLVVVTVAGAVAPLVLSAWVLWPLDRAAKLRRRAVRYTLGDLFSLVFLFQLPLAASRPMWHGLEAPTSWLIVALGSIVASLIWGVGVSTISRAGIDDRWQRALLVFLVLPLAYYGVFALYISGVNILGAWHAPIGATRTKALVRGGTICFSCLAATIWAGWFTRRVTGTSRAI